MFETERAPGLDEHTPAQLLGFTVSTRVDEQRGQVPARFEGAVVPIPVHALLYRQRVAQQRLGLGLFVLVHQGCRER